MEISYHVMVAAISILWCAVRTVVAVKEKTVNWKREAQLLLVYVCIIVIVRFTFCPFGRVGGQIQPLVFDAARVWPPRINLIPFVYMTDYVAVRECVLNFVGNTLMFLPVGIVFPWVYRKLDCPPKALAAGVGFSLVIEVLQLPFYDRVSDVDDLILNSLGYALGYLIYLGIKGRKSRSSE